MRKYAHSLMVDVKDNLTSLGAALALTIAYPFYKIYKKVR